MSSFDDPEVRDFLMYGTRTAKVAYTASDGRALVAPIWFVLDGGDLVFNTGARTAKGRSLARDPRLALSVDLEEPPFAFVQVQGEAQLSEEPSELLRTATAIAARYMGSERAEEFGRRNGAPGSLVVRVRPTKIIAEMDMVA
ncbi:PPOX class F420-dependent oxidoreductase [Nocardiopsis xinjiangensis]|uniref:PPOX class F420-dependent oxidoreductase n=1 Tax=Nocardiopsis xinjiangensis TaxID=124285 RepID=UPI00034C949D|nr:PPOX class F420-dependent oxidoreductase [Nocardiopsis xinjiangensis]